jgi:hypothetical protein
VGGGRPTLAAERVEQNLARPLAAVSGGAKIGDPPGALDSASDRLGDLQRGQRALE